MSDNNHSPALKDAWGRELPTKLVLISSISYHNLIEQVIQAARKGATLHPTHIKTHSVPYEVCLLLPEGYEEKATDVVYEPSQGDGKINIKSFNKFTFFTNLVKVAGYGCAIQPAMPVYKTPFFMVHVLSKAPVANCHETVIGTKKATYTADELENFNIEELKNIGSWYKLSFNSKKKYIKHILELQPILEVSND